MCHPSIVRFYTLRFYTLYRVVIPRFICPVLLFSPPVAVPTLTYWYYRPCLAALYVTDSGSCCPYLVGMLVSQPPP